MSSNVQIGIKGKFLLLLTLALVVSFQIHFFKDYLKGGEDNDTDGEMKKRYNHSVDDALDEEDYHVHEPRLHEHSIMKPFTFSRIFKPWKDRKKHLIPCIVHTDGIKTYRQGQPTNEGLLYVKLEKAASTTLASVALRSAEAIAYKRHVNTTIGPWEVPKMCKFRGVSHMWSKRSPPFEQRNHDKSFLWTFVKDPLRRVLSVYFFFEIDWEPGKNEYTGK